MKDWQQIRTQTKDASGIRKRFCLYLPKSAAPVLWQKTASQYLNGQIPALETIPSSRKARVQAGYISNVPHRHFFKQVFPRSHMEYIKQIFRKSRAYRDLKGTTIAASRGLQVPEVNCVIEEKKWGIIIRSVIITREVKGAIQLAKLLEKLHLNAKIRTRRHLMRQLGAEMARWHRAGMRHGDARDSNILCRIPENPNVIGVLEKPENMMIEFCWLDNERSRPVFRKRDFIRNLVQLNMTRKGITITDRMRFWDAYWADAGHIYSPRAKKTILRKVLAKTRKRWEISGWL